VRANHTSIYVKPFTLFLLLVFVLLEFNTVNSYASTENIPSKFKLPSRVKYVENKNQWEDFVRYEADFRGGKLFLEDNRFTYIFYNSDDMLSLHPHEGGSRPEKIRLHAVKVNIKGGNGHPQLKPEDPASYFENYFLGSDRSKWASKVQLFTSVTYKDVYPGIDQQFYSAGNDVKYDFIVKPGSSTDKIILEYEGVDHLSLHKGELQMELSVGTIVEQNPYAYQVINGVETPVSCKFVLSGNTLSFKFPKGYNHSIPLIIDPTLVFSTYTGSNSDNWGFTATYDANGDAYSGGNVEGFGYPVTPGAYQVTYGGGGFGGNGFSCDMAIIKLNPTGTSILYATYLGGSDNEQPQSLVVDGNDNLIIFGTTYSANFPTTAGAYDNSYNGQGDMTISKLSSDGTTLLGSTFVGSSQLDGMNTDPAFTTTGPLKYNYSDEARGEIIYDSNNDYILATCSKSPNFPTTPGTLQPVYGGGLQDGVLFKINTSLTALVWSTFIGGTGVDAVYDVVIDQNNDLYIAGGTTSSNLQTTPTALHPAYMGGVADGFLQHISNSGSTLLAGTFIGTASYDQTYFIELDNSGNVYTTGQTEGAYPVSPGVYSNPNGKQFIHKMDENFSTTFYSTVFGKGSTYPDISPTAFLVDTCENVYVAGWGRCLSLGAFTPGNVNGMPVTANAYQTTTNGCDFYFFVLSPNALALAYATFFGGAFSQEHVDGGTSRFDKNGVIYESVCAGCGGNSDFPTTPGVVSNTNNSNNCNNGIIKLAFNLAATVSSITTTPNIGCVPFTLTLTNSSINASSFVWDFGDGSPQDFTFQPTHTWVDTGTYTVMLVAINGLSCNQNDTSYATITVTPPIPPVAAFNLNQISTCDTFSVATVFTGSFGNSYQWDFGDGYTTTGNSASHIYSDTGTFVITLINEDTLCPAADTISQTVSFTLLEVTAVAAATTSSGCTPLTVSFNSNGSSGVTYLWDFGDGSNPSSAANPSHTYTQQGNFNVLLIVSDPLSCNGADTVIMPMAVYLSIPINLSFNVTSSLPCDSTWASVNFTGSGGSVYHWDFGDGFTTSGLSATHSYANTGSYIIQLIADDTLCSTADTLMQTVTFLPPPIVFADASGDTSGCEPMTVTLNSSGSQGSNHFWDFRDGTNTDTSYHPTHTFTQAGNYQVMFIVNDPSSCNGADTAFVNIQVADVPPLDAAFNMVSTTACDSFFASMNFNGVGGTFYNWDFGDGTSASGLSTSHTFPGTGTYLVTLTVSDTACPNEDQAMQLVAFHPPVNATSAALGATRGCTPFIAQFSGSANGNHFWNFGDGTSNDTSLNPSHIFMNAGQFDVMFIASDPNSCNGADTSHVMIDVPPSTPIVVSFNMNTSQICDSLWTSVNFTGSGGQLHHWNFGDGTYSDLFSLTHYYDSPGTYDVTFISEDTVCDRSDSITESVTFLPTVYAGINTSNVFFGCIPQTLHLTNSFGSQGNYIWNFGDSTISNEPVIDHVYEDTGTYRIQLVVYDSGSCNISDTGNYTLQVFESPRAVFDLDQQDAYFFSDVDFYDHSTLADFYSWDLADGTVLTANDSVFHHRYEKGGDYNICLYVSTINGCIDTACRTISVEYAETIYVPNAITLNGDGKNDIFQVYCTGILEIQVDIFNRWGEQIYEYTTVEGGWNGKYNDHFVQEDVYVYRIHAKGVVHPNIYKIGTVTVAK
jgi:gliding motility-associated-like protein